MNNTMNNTTNHEDMRAIYYALTNTTVELDYQPATFCHDENVVMPECYTLYYVLPEWMPDENCYMPDEYSIEVDATTLMHLIAYINVRVAIDAVLATVQDPSDYNLPF